MQRNPESDSTRMFAEQCRIRGLKVTPQRTAIYRALAGSMAHPSADMVYRSVIREFPHISFETVNRTLLKFAETGILNIVESCSGVRRFDSDPEPHHHIHCIRCGKIIDFKHDRFDRLKIPQEFEHDYTVVGKRVVIHVICRQCASENKKSNQKGENR